MIAVIDIYRPAYSIRPGSCFFPVVCFLLAWPGSATAFDIATIAIEQLQSEQVQLEGISSELTFDSLTEFGLHIHVGRLLHRQYGELKNIRISCPGKIINSIAFRCAGGKAIAEIDQHKLNVSFDLTVASDKTVNGSIAMQTQALPVSVLQPLIESGVELAAPMTGSADITVSMQIVGNRPASIDLLAQVTDLAAEAGSAFEAVAAEFTLQADRQTDWQFSSRLQMQRGAMYLSPGVEILNDTPGFFIDLDDKPLELTASGVIDDQFSLLQLTDFTFQHAGHIDLTAAAVIQNRETPELKSLSLQVNATDLDKTWPVYIQPILLATQFSELELTGGLALRMQYTGEELTDFKLKLDQVFLHDVDERFSVSGLSADFDIGASEQQRLSTIDWQSISLYKLIFGAGDITFLSSDDYIEIIDWRDVSLLDGALLINDFSISDFSLENFRLKLNGELKPVSLQEFTQSLGWPLMSGKLSGEIDGVQYHKGNLSVDGDIRFRVFDGEVFLRDLSIENLFSVNSRLLTNITITGLDLEQLTQTFSFGKIEGTIGGYVHELTLINWQPVYFDMVLRSPDKDPRPHRISQRALDNLSEIGGGLSGSLSSGWMRFIPEYSYGRLGIRCLLSNNVCNLGGIEPAQDGFYIMTRGGLIPPWVDVKGTGRSIIWQDLVGGLQRIAEGEPVFE